MQKQISDNQISDNLAKALGLTHFLETLFLQTAPEEKTSNLQKHFQSHDAAALLFDFSSILVAPLYYQYKAAEQFLTVFVEAFSGVIYLFNKQDDKKNESFENTLKALSGYLQNQGKAVVSPFLNALSFLCRSLLAAYELVKNPPESLMQVAGFFKRAASYVAGSIGDNFNHIIPAYENQFVNKPK